VHLQWSAAESEAFYVEATVEQSTPGTYVSAIGWSGGYFGVQELRDGKKVAIFSVWDPTKGDDPKAVKPEERVELLHEGEGVRIKRFGGEGTGGQCMVDFPWVVGETVRFLVRAEVHDAGGGRGAVGEAEAKTAYAGWIFDPQHKAWRHLVTFRTRNNGKLLRGVLGLIVGFGDDGGIGVAHMAHLAMGQHRALGFAHGRPVAAVDQPACRVAAHILEILAREDGQNTRHLCCIGGVDRLDPTMRHARADKDRIGLAVQRHVVGVNPATGQKADIFAAL
jgi:hypothetical protein